jgi:hypothetical protein
VRPHGSSRWLFILAKILLGLLVFIVAAVVILVVVFLLFVRLH